MQTQTLQHHIYIIPLHTILQLQATLRYILGGSPFQFALKKLLIRRQLNPTKRHEIKK